MLVASALASLMRLISVCIHSVATLMSSPFSLFLFLSFSFFFCGGDYTLNISSIFMPLWYC
jgi:hypothetical protein